MEPTGNIRFVGVLLGPADICPSLAAKPPVKTRVAENGTLETLRPSVFLGGEDFSRFP